MKQNTKQNLEYMQKGVTISPASPVVGDKVTILYDGILSKKGAAQIFAYIGYGSNWDNGQEIPMIKGTTCFETTVPALKEDFMQISFKDPTGSLDDNQGSNYSFDVSG